MRYSTFCSVITVAIVSQGQTVAGPPSQQATDTIGPDTAWVETANPVFTPAALVRLEQLWSSRNYRGVCLRGEVKDHERLGEAAHVTHVFSAAFPELCGGFKNIGAALFQYEAAESDPEFQSACDLLSGHPEWAVTAVVTGIETRKLRNPEGRPVAIAAAPIASYCAWLRKEPAEPPKPEVPQQH